MRPRFNDRDEPSRYLRQDHALVHCPRCASMAVATRTRSMVARVTCIACGLAREGLRLNPDTWSAVTAKGRCPHCGRKITVERQIRGFVQVLPVRCDGCATAFRLPTSESRSVVNSPAPEFAGLELWLQTPFAGHVLWAYDEVHLDFLERYVAAGVREQGPGNSSLASRLPGWIKAAKNRDVVQDALARLRATLAVAERSKAPDR